MIIIINNNTSKRAFIFLKAFFFFLPLSHWILAICLRKGTDALKSERTDLRPHSSLRAELASDSRGHPDSLSRTSQRVGYTRQWPDRHTASVSSSLQGAPRVLTCLSAICHVTPNTDLRLPSVCTRGWRLNILGRQPLGSAVSPLQSRVVGVPTAAVTGSALPCR